MTEPSAADEPAGPDAATRVARGMLHEIRNVLNPIVSAAWLLQTNAENPEKVRELAARIEKFAKAEERVAAKMKELLAQESATDDEPAEGAGAQRSTAPSSITRRTP